MANAIEPMVREVFATGREIGPNMEGDLVISKRGSLFVVAYVAPGSWVPRFTIEHERLDTAIDTLAEKLRNLNAMKGAT